MHLGFDLRLPSMGGINAVREEERRGEKNVEKNKKRKRE
jgi:hypothetical protein